MLRRVEPTPSADAADGRIKSGGLVIEPRKRSVEVMGASVDLTAREFDLLFYLASHPGEVFTREQLMTGVWDYSIPGDSSTVTVHMRRVREKIEPDPANPRWLKTVWGVGYKFDPGPP